ncbi:MAG: complex I NDUFA9 subunit family protein [Candidatus Zixiibacteriota bacterium]|nr:MAG: complex I NDUFA9 subunit family protein [candidate division Zixibacteria bacterium]
MKIAVTGGTGFVGRNLVNRLLSEGYSVTVTTHKSPATGLIEGNISYAEASVGDVDNLRRAFDGALVVYHLVGIIAETKRKTFQMTVVEGTKNVVEACRKSGVKKIIYLSAMGTSADASTVYHQTKYLAEQAVVSSGLEYVIFRPSVIYGPGDGFVSLLTKMIKASPITPVIGDGRYMLQPVYIDDVVSAMVGALTVRSASGRTIELGGPEKLEYLEILNIIRRVLNKRQVNLHIPLWVMKPAAFIMEKIVKPAPVTRDQLAMMQMGNTGDIAPMIELFSLSPVKLEDGLRKYLR